ncbi:hypothetical protein [Kitasatospora sp. KL5]|uniref:hypothetical protein n=1 Tax=Kitasatospora sp. KL5 TaxID=3425125 RepID=UPI003D6F6FEC
MERLRINARRRADATLQSVKLRAASPSARRGVSRGQRQRSKDGLRKADREREVERVRTRGNRVYLSLSD